ncbi:hypothetical protein [Shinella sp.]|uniref:hypothetical protein n=1 Tax=Shinella sp. TaxID=1870904 RepID=UPI00301BC43D
MSIYPVPTHATTAMNGRAVNRLIDLAWQALHAENVGEENDKAYSDRHVVSCQHSSI